MSKRTHFTTVTALPAGITRETVLSTLHAHTEMIDLNPLVIERHPIRPPPNASPEEAHCQWYSISDKISYLPGVNGSLTFTSCFHDLPDGLQTHVFAPMGLDMKGRWTLGGSLPGEPRQPQELGLGVPKQGLWLKESIDMRCNFAMVSFVKKTTKKAHGTLVDRLVEKAHLTEGETYNQQLAEGSISGRDSVSMPPTYDHIAPSTGTMGSSVSRYSHNSGSDAGSLRSGISSHQGTPRLSTTNMAGPDYAQHPAYAHHLQQQQHQQPTNFPPDVKHPYAPETTYAPLPPQSQTRSQYHIDPDLHPHHHHHHHQQQQQQYQHGGSLPLHKAHQQQQQQQQHPQHQRHPSYTHAQDPSLYPQPLKSSSRPVSGQQQQQQGTGQMSFAVELPGKEASTPTELAGGAGR